MIELSKFQKLRLRIIGHVPIGTRRKKDWTADIMHYAFKCSIHGIVVDYPHGFEERLRCPKCLDDYLRKKEAIS